MAEKTQTTINNTTIKQMPSTVGATKTTFAMAGLDIDCYTTARNSHLYSGRSAVKAVGVEQNNVFTRWLATSNYSSTDFNQVQVTGIKPFYAFPAEVIAAFWEDQASKGNLQAKALVTAGIAEALTRRADTVNHTTQTEQAYEAQTTNIRKSVLQAFILAKVGVGDYAAAKVQLTNEEYEMYRVTCNEILRREREMNTTPLVTQNDIRTMKQQVVSALF